MTPAALRTAADVLDQLVDRERHAAVADALRVLAQRGEVSARDLVERGHGGRTARRATVIVGEALGLTRVRGDRGRGVCTPDVWRLACGR